MLAFSPLTISLTIDESTPPYTMIANVTAVDDDSNSILMYTRAAVIDVIGADGQRVEGRR